MSKFDYCLFIGRFQPFHNGHHAVLKHALSIADKAIIVIGSANQTPNARNPWTAEEREVIVYPRKTHASSPPGRGYKRHFN
jgi:bifunctional NMN adenylyltransferase/nudix hydrolase